MDRDRASVYVPEPAPRASAPSAADDFGASERWPPTVYRPVSGEAEGALAHAVEDVLRPGAGPGVREEDVDVSAVFRDPATARAVADRLARAARDLDCVAVAGLEPGGPVLAAPAADRAGLPLVVLRRTSDGLSAPTGALSGGDRVLVVDDVLGDGDRQAEACGAVERAGAEVAGIWVLAELAGRDGRRRLEEYNIWSLTEL